jgi:hypothetical protein
VAEGLRVLGTEVVGHASALGRILCQEVRASDPLPPFPASIKVVRAWEGGVKKILAPRKSGQFKENSDNRKKNKKDL